MLAGEKCTPPKAGDQPLAAVEAAALAQEVRGWEFGQAALEREYRFDDFRGAMRFVNDVARVADAESHHPDIFISFRRVRLTFTTHKVGGLTRNDFIMAAKVDRLASGQDGLA